MKENLPSWPGSLPLPISVQRGEQASHRCVTDFEKDIDFVGTIHDLYWFPDCKDYVYLIVDSSVGSDFIDRLNRVGIETNLTEFYFYSRPRAARPNDFIQLIPGDPETEGLPQWVRDAAKGEMYKRILLSLAPWKRKELDFIEGANVTARTIAEGEPILELKPNFQGLGINLKSLWRWLGKRKAGRKNGSPH